MVFDNVSLLIVGLVVLAGLSLVYGNQEVLLMVVGGLLGFLAKDKSSVLGTPKSEPKSVDEPVDVEDIVEDDAQ